MTDSQLGDLSLTCMRCGFCTAVCPTYRETGLETASPRGRVALIRAVAEGKLSPTPRLAQYLYRCLDCLACREVCPSGVQLEELILRARARLNGVHGPSLLKKAVLRSTVPHPGRLERAQKIARLYQRSGLGWLLERFPGRLRDFQSLLPPLPSRPLQRQLPEVVPSRAGPAQLRVAYFPGCAHSYLLTSVGRASVEALAANSCEVVMPAGLRCCGMPHRAYGEADLAWELARHNIDALLQAGADAIITDCATCGSALKGYRRLLEDDPVYAERAAKLAGKVQDISEFLPRVSLAVVSREVPGRVTYHDPCHLGRGQGVKEEPRALLRAIPGLELVEMREADWCCGGAGGYNLTNYELSMSILDRKMENIATTRAELVATGCPACLVQLRLGAKRKGLRVKVVHPIELLARSYRGEEPSA